MDTVLDLLQALGIGAAVGIRPFLPALLVGALAAGNAGVDFEHTDFAFLEKAPWLLGMLAGVAVFDFIRRRQGDDWLDAGSGLLVTAALAGVIAAFEGMGSTLDRGGSAAAGGIAALIGAGLAGYVTCRLFMRVRTRLGAEAGLLPLYREAAALAAAGLSVLFPPLALLAVGGLLFLMRGGQRREGEKYAGLRILR